MSTQRPLTDKEIRALVNDAVDLTLPQARNLFAQYQQVESDMPTDNYAATLTNLLDAIFYMRFGGQWRATAAPHVFQPIIYSSRPPPLSTVTPPQREPPTISERLVRNISRALFAE